MNTKFYTSTNWLPWLGGGFLLSIFIFGFVSNWFLMAFLVLLSFLPAIAVRLNLNSYFVVESNRIKLCYDHPKERETSFEVEIPEISAVRRVGKSVVIHYGQGDEYSSRVHKSEEFVVLLKKYNPKIELITN